jgi:phosphoglycolate phosphatase-like HAD superfamily hydrolase
MNTNYLVYDFDGVLCDSTLEIMITSYYAYSKYKSIEVPSKYSQDTIPIKYRDTFIKYRPSTRNAKDFYILWDMIFNEKKINVSVILSEQWNINANIIESFRELFYKERITWRNSDNAGWLDKNPLYKGIKKTLLSNTIKDSYFIVSAKDSDSIYRILKNNEIEIDINKIFGSENNKDKDILFKELMQINKIKPNNLFFIDDSLTNLITIKNLGVNSFFATWGYNYNRDLQISEENDIPNICLDDFYNFYPLG